MLKTTFGFRDYGFELVTDDPGVMEFCRQYTSMLTCHVDEISVRYFALSTPTPTFRPQGDPEIDIRSIGGLAGFLESAIVRDLIAMLNHRYPVYHGAALLEGDKVNIYIGGSNAGKSTLCAQKVAAGAVYLSDEIVPVSGEEVIAVPRPICFNSLENDQSLIPDDPNRFDRFERTFTMKNDQQATAYYLLPKANCRAAAGDRLALGDIIYLERDETGPPRQIVLKGSEKRARLELHRLVR